MHRRDILRILAAVTLASSPAALAQELPGDPAPPAGARPIQKLKHEDLGAVTSVVVDQEGTHAYAASYQGCHVTIFERNAKTGRLTFGRSLTGDHYKGSVAFRLSADQKWGAASCFNSESVILFGRNPETGELEELDHAGAGAPGDGLDFCIDNVFSPDGAFLYTVGSDAIAVFSTADRKLKQVETFREAMAVPQADTQPGAGLMSNGRGIAISPDGRWLYTAWTGSGTLLVCSRDSVTGKLTQLQAVQNGQDVDGGLDGVMRVTVDPKGKTVYTSSGRFGGTDAVCAFTVMPDGKLICDQILKAADLPAGFSGGNEIALSPSGSELAVACTLSDQLARFSRDPKTGRLKALESVASGEAALPGAAGVTYSPDGEFIHVADETSDSVVTFKIGK